MILIACVDDRGGMPSTTEGRVLILSFGIGYWI